jgi:putative hydrolase of the HAD superfamily
MKVVFFDLDDTLIYEDASDEAVMVEVVRELLPGADLPPPAIVAAVRTAARALWQHSGEFEYCRRINTSSIEGLYGDYAGDDPRLQNLRRYLNEGRYREQAWGQALQTLGVGDSGGLATRLAAAYAEMRHSRNVPFPDASPALERLAPRCRLALITNGAPRVQRDKLAGSGLAAYFDPVVVSGDLGIGKPDPIIYRHALELAGVSAADALMVGNSLPNDVAGAQTVGIRAIWINRNAEPLPPGIEPYQTVTGLDDVRLE